MSTPSKDSQMDEEMAEGNSKLEEGMEEEEIIDLQELEPTAHNIARLETTLENDFYDFEARMKLLLIYPKANMPEVFKKLREETLLHFLLPDGTGPFFLFIDRKF